MSSFTFQTMYKKQSQHETIFCNMLYLLPWSEMHWIYGNWNWIVFLQRATIETLIE